MPGLVGIRRRRPVRVYRRRFWSHSAPGGDMVKRVLVLGVIAFATASCAVVAPYRRGRLAHPTMAPDHGASPARDHVHAVHEGAVGGGMEVSSGCGCN